MKLVFMRFVLLVFLLSLYSILPGQETVYVEAGSESGRGVLKTRGDECFAIVPHHLLRDHFGTVSVYGEGSVLAQADLVKSYTADLAILRFDKGSNLFCNSWKVDRDFDKVIDVVTKCKLEMRERTGGLSTMAMTVTGIDDEFLYIEPDNFRETIAKGMSGSAVFTEYNGKKVYLGMLQRVNGKVGEVLKASKMDQTLSDFFNPKKKIRYGGGDSNVSMGIVRESGGFRFELRDIERNGSNLSLKFNVVSLNKDNTLGIYHRSVSLFDDQGSESNASNIVIGSQSGGSVRYNMVHGVSVPMELNFNSISSSTDLATLFKFQFTEDRTNKVIEIRDLELPGGTSYDSKYDGESIDGSQAISGFKFDLLHISKSGKDVICKFNVTSLDRDREIQLYFRHILLYDDKGLENAAENIQIGNQSGSSIRYNLIHGITTPLELKFTTVNSSAESIALLKIPFRTALKESEYQLRNISFDTYSAIDGNNNSNCSELYFYRMKGVLQCEDNITLTNHGEKVLVLPVGSRYKVVVCDDRELDFKASIGAEELLAGYERPVINLGKTYYFKVGCTLGKTSIVQQDSDKGKVDLNKKGKYKNQVQSFQLNAW